MYRIGQSSDIHKFCEGDHIVLGGKRISFTKGMLAHSDGDALTHAIAESILGALALGDLGQHFPDTDERYKGIASIQLLERVVELMESKGYAIQNIDSLILIEQPMMFPHIEDMRENIAKALHTKIENVSVKATRGEKLGFIGRGEGVLCQCVILLKKEKNKDE